MLLDGLDLGGFRPGCSAPSHLGFTGFSPPPPARYRSRGAAGVLTAGFSANTSACCFQHWRSTIPSPRRSTRFYQLSATAPNSPPRSASGRWFSLNRPSWVLPSSAANGVVFSRYDGFGAATSPIRKDYSKFFSLNRKREKRIARNLPPRSQWETNCGSSRKNVSRARIRTLRFKSEVQQSDG